MAAVNGVVAEPEEPEPCRLCDNVADKMFNIFDDNPEGYQLIGLIKENLPIVLYKTDPLSKRVCEKCVSNLQIISSLKKLSRKTQEKYVEKLKNQGDTTDKNVLLFLGCTGSKLVENGDDEEEDEEEELKDEATSTEDLTVLCVNCKTAILDASTVNGDVELAGDLHEIIRESLRKNRALPGDSEKSLRSRKVRPLYQELDDSLCSSLTDLPAAVDEESEQESEESNNDEEDERPAKRRKLDSSEQIQDEINESLRKSQQASSEEDEEEEQSSSSEHQSREPSEVDDETKDRLEEEKQSEIQRVESIKAKCEEIFKEEPSVVYEPLSLMEIVLNCINKQNMPNFEAQPYKIQSTKCRCKTCGEEFQNVKILALHEPEHMEVEFEEKIDNPEPWPGNRPYAKIRNKWLTFFDESDGPEEEEDEDGVHLEDNHPDDNPRELLIQDMEKTVDATKKDEVVLVNMKPVVNGVYLGDYSKEERKVFYQCMRIGGQTKRFCPLCRYCFKDNWAIESHYFSFACYYTCRYCGMRFNKQRHRFEEHTNEHIKKGDTLSEKIYTASKVNNILPKVIQPDKVKRVVPGEPEKPREINLGDYSTPPVITKGGFDQRNRYNSPGQTTFQAVKVKEEPKDNFGGVNKTQNQAYFCRKCYKVFFKLDEFNAHSKNCDYSNYSPNNARLSQGSPGAVKGPIKIKQEPGLERRVNGGDISNAGRPLRNCAKDIGPYKDEVYIPKQILNETVPGPQQSFICHICGTPFPTIYSRNSHMRIHKGEGVANGASPSPQMIAQQTILKQRLQQQQQHTFQMQKAALQQRQKQMQQRIGQQMGQYNEVRVKEEPVDSFEPMVEIHEGHERSPSPPPPSPAIVPRELSGGAVSLTPIVKKPALNPSILKLVQNNPNISLVSKKPTPKPTNGEALNQRTQGGNIIKNAGGYQGPYAPGNQQLRSEAQTGYITVSSNLMPNDDNKSYKCSSCWEAFSNKSHLYFHKKNQCEGSRFPCPFCKKRFGTEAAYSSHIFYSHPE